MPIDFRVSLPNLIVLVERVLTGMNTLFRMSLLFLSLLMAFGSTVVAPASAQTPDDDDTFDTYGAEPRALPDDVVEMVVDSVVDGDTLHLTYPDDDWYYPVRIIGIDAPEKDGPYTREECYGKESTNELARLLPVGTYVYVERDVSDEDRNGRWLRHVWLPFAVDGEDVDDEAYLVSEILVRGGWVDAKTYKPDDKYESILNKAEKDASKRDAGIWGACDL
jgi:endonuclease YncB( thermonuclease family)